MGDKQHTLLADGVFGRLRAFSRQIMIPTGEERWNLHERFQKVSLSFWRDDADMTLRNPTTLGSKARGMGFVFVLLLCDINKDFSHICFSFIIVMAIIIIAAPDLQPWRLIILLTINPSILSLT